MHPYYADEVIQGEKERQIKALEEKLRVATEELEFVSCWCALVWSKTDDRNKKCGRCEALAKIKAPKEE